MIGREEGGATARLRLGTASMRPLDELSDSTDLACSAVTGAAAHLVSRSATMLSSPAM